VALVKKITKSWYGFCHSLFAISFFRSFTAMYCRASPTWKSKVCLFSFFLHSVLIFTARLFG
jgi:hypothetical protein